MEKSSSLIVSSHSPDEAGNKLIITPETAGWKYVGFQVYELKPGKSLQFETNQMEACVVILSGIVSVSTQWEQWNKIGARMSVFEQSLPYSFYVAHHDFFRLEALTDVEAAICLAPGGGSCRSRLLPPDETDIEIRGYGNMERRIHHILPEEKEAFSLLVVEVFTPNGHWSSYPPHKHDVNNLPHESYLEETYYHKLNPGDGIALQRLYTDNGDLDVTLAVRSDDAVLVPRGYHPVSVPPGYDSYYLNVMAGPVRTWKFQNDPRYEWLLEKPKHRNGCDE